MSKTPFYGNLERLTLDERSYRRVLHTGRFLQLVTMSLLPLQEIGTETHLDHDQFIRVEKGRGLAIIDQMVYTLTDGDSVVIPAGTEHNIINTDAHKRLQLYTIYAPPEHPPNKVQDTK
jgi:mannose-6-phosphate isomerase-like protein (cupin superfamily)